MDIFIGMIIHYYYYCSLDFFHKCLSIVRHFLKHFQVVFFNKKYNRWTGIIVCFNQSEHLGIGPILLQL